MHATASRVVECPNSMIGRVIEKSGETINTIQASTGAVVQSQQDSNPFCVTISGSIPVVESAYSLAEEIARDGTPFSIAGNAPGIYGKQTATS